MLLVVESAASKNLVELEGIKGGSILACGRSVTRADIRERCRVIMELTESGDGDAFWFIGFRWICWWRRRCNRRIVGWMDSVSLESESVRSAVEAVVTEESSSITGDL